MALAPRLVIVHRRSEYSELLDKHATFGQAEFFLRTRGRRIEDVIARHEAIEDAVRLVTASVPADMRQARVERDELDRYLFAPEDIVVAVGQDGLVANVAKYLTGQPVVGVNPEPGRNAGVLVTVPPERAGAVVATILSGTAASSPRAMVSVTLDDGQKMHALNEFYIGDPGHQSSRYTIEVPGHDPERQSSSGIIVGTGTGSTGWSTSIAQDRDLRQILPAPAARSLAWFVREAWPSPATSTTLTYGTLSAQEQLVVQCESEQLVAFGDGIEKDRLTMSWGQTLTIGTATTALNLVVP